MITGSMFGASMIGGSMISGSMLPGGQTRSFEGYPLLVDVPSSRKASRYTIFGNTNADAVGVGDHIPQLFSPITRSLLSRGIDVSVSGNSVSFSGTRSESGEIVVQLGSVAAGHKLVFCSRNVGNCNIQLFASGHNPVYIDAANSVAVSPFDMDYYFQVGRGDSEGAAYNEHGAICVFDVTGTPYEDVTTADEFAHRLGYADAEHLPAFPYGSSFVAPIRVGSRNLWDEEWELGAISSVDGRKLAGSGMRTKNYISIKDGENLYFYCPAINQNVRTRFYDANKTYIGYLSAQGSTFAWNRVDNLTTPLNARYMLIEIQAEYGATYNHDICVNLSDSRNGEYSPYFAPTLYPSVLSSPLHKIGDIVDYKESNGKEHHAFGVVDLGSLNWGSGGLNIYSTRVENMKVVTSLSERNKGIFTAVYPPDTQTSIASTMTDKTMLRYNGNIYIRDNSISGTAAFKAAMQGVMLVYELATPTEVQGEPLPRLAIPKGESIVTLDTAVEPSNITAKI